MKVRIRLDTPTRRGSFRKLQTTDAVTQTCERVIHHISRHRQNLRNTATASDGVQCALELSTTHMCRQFQ